MNIFGLEDSKKSNDIFIWIFILVIILGFGKLKNTFINPANLGNCHSSKHHRKRKEDICTKKWQGPMEFGNVGRLFKGNGIFILIIIVILFLCKDSPAEIPCTSTSTGLQYDIDDEVEDLNDSNEDCDECEE